MAKQAAGPPLAQQTNPSRLTDSDINILAAEGLIHLVVSVAVIQNETLLIRVLMCLHFATRCDADESF